ncbi:polysaccharide biosynthesis protein [Halobacillus yeomjeoni]|uniref:polysaccharide biosynthesis protein n=1 Tax=Halobacillus yeomjeoni TaxID=311194 RepID=UPI001CD72585|nr:nucleoside-diphosphate sugar epimerase/dehydratase [Halobacillus yeomjeoni]MCA0985130.1 polysaccharide biosynthesis protein [Halobacillus yeomjeoni]
MSKQQRLVYFSILDTFIVFAAIYISTLFMFPSSPVFTFQLFILSSTLMVSYLVFASIYKIYQRAWEYASAEEVVVLVKSVTFAVLTAALIQSFISSDVYYRVLASTWMMQILMILASRYSFRLYKDRNKGTLNKEGKRTLIIGAGMAGTYVAKQLKSNTCELNPVAFIDDDPLKQALHILNIPVVGGVEHLEEYVQDMDIDNIVIAIPSLSKKKLFEIQAACHQTGKETQMIPMIEDLVTGKLAVDDMKKVEFNDLLGRDPVDLDTQSMKSFIQGEILLVTGAGGSIGSEICRQVSSFEPAAVILLGHGENSIYTIERELKESYGDRIQYYTEIADIKDRDRMMKVMSQYRPKVVIHAAAHKHVPLMERNPFEAVTNNVYGTKNVADAADASGVDTFIMISSDKAVNPTSVMGSTKRIAEMVVQDLNKKSGTRFVAVRFGNVLGSRGSVIPLFLDQIRKGGPVTVTDPEMTRYFMTIPEASRLVLQSGALAQGGEVFVLDMGEPVKIVDLAKNLIKLSGYTEQEIGIHFSGIRPGEKLYEELLNDNEIKDIQVHPRIHVGNTVDFDIELVLKTIENLSMKEDEEIREVLLSIPRQYSKSVAAVQ